MDLFSWIIIICVVMLIATFSIALYKQWQYGILLEKHCEELSSKLEETEYKYAKNLTDVEREAVDKILATLYLNDRNNGFSGIVLENLVALSNFDFDKLYDGAMTVSDMKDVIAVLFAIVSLLFPETAWVSDRNSRGKLMYDNYFMCGVLTPTGPVSYCFDPKYRHLFDTSKHLAAAPFQDSISHTEQLIRLYNAFFVTTEGDINNAESEPSSMV